MVWGMLSDISRQSGQVCNLSEQPCVDKLLVKFSAILCVIITLADNRMVLLVV